MKVPAWIALLAAAAAPLPAKPAAWIRLEGADFTLYSPGTEADIRGWAVDFEEFRQGIGKFLHTNEVKLDPVTVILFRTDREMRPYKPLENGRAANLDGFFVRPPMGNFIAATTAADDDRTRRLIFHEGVHWMIDVGEEPPPLWLNEGLAEVFSTFSTQDDLYNYGAPIQGHVYLLNHATMMPIKELIGVQPGSLLYNEGERTSIFYAESWAFVHYLLFSDGGQQRARYNQLVRALRPGTDADAVFRQVFGVDCAGLDRRLAAYLHSGSYVINRIHFDRRQVERDLKVRPADPVEVELAEASILAAVDRPSEALPRLRRLTAANPGLTLAWEAEGWAAYEAQDRAEAVASLTQAAAHGSQHAFTYSYLGDATLGVAPAFGADTPPHPTSASPGEARQAFTYYEQELALKPYDRHAYDNCAGNADLIEPLTPADLALLRQGAAIYPHDLLIRVGLADAALKQGDAATGLADLRRIAAARLAVNQDAANFARVLLANHERAANIAQLNDLFRRQDFSGVLAFVDALLAGAPDYPDRDLLLQGRGQADAVLKVRQAAKLISAGDHAGAEPLLRAADGETSDRQLHAQIQRLLGLVSSGNHARRRKSAGAANCRHKV